MEEIFLKKLLNITSNLIDDTSFALKLNDDYNKKTNGEILSELKLITSNQFDITREDAHMKTKFFYELISIMTNRNKHEVVVDLLVDVKFCASYRNILEIYFPLMMSEKKNKEKYCLLICPIINSVYAMSNNASFGQNFTDEGLIELYVHCLCGNNFSDFIIIDNEMRQDIGKTFLCTIVNLLHVIKNEDSKYRLRKNNGIRICEKYEHSIIPMIDFCAFTIKMYLISESDRLDADKLQIEFAIIMLNASLEERYIDNYISSAEEAIEIVNRIALCDSNKSKCVTAGVFESYFAVLKKINKVEDNVIILALQALQMFSEKYSAEIKLFPNAKEVIENLLQNNNDIIKIEANHVLSIFRDSNVFQLSKFEKIERDQFKEIEIKCIQIEKQLTNSNEYESRELNLVEVESVNETEVKSLAMNKETSNLMNIEFANKVPVLTWNKYDVLVWFESKNLLHLRKSFSNYDGTMLLELAKMKQNASEIFYNYFLKENISLEDTTHMAAALEELTL